MINIEKFSDSKQKNYYLTSEKDMYLIYWTGCGEFRYPQGQQDYPDAQSPQRSEKSHEKSNQQSDRHHH